MKASFQEQMNRVFTEFAVKSYDEFVRIAVNCSNAIVKYLNTSLTLQKVKEYLLRIIVTFASIDGQLSIYPEYRLAFDIWRRTFGEDLPYEQYKSAGQEISKNPRHDWYITVFSEDYDMDTQFKIAMATFGLCICGVDNKYLPAERKLISYIMDR